LAKKHYSILNIHLWSTLILMLGLMVWWSNLANIQGAVYAVLAARLITLPLVIYGIVWSLKHPETSFREIS
jgi:hypothetical protein